HLELLRYTIAPGLGASSAWTCLVFETLPACLQFYPNLRCRPIAEKFPCATGICVWRSFFLPVHKSGDAPVRTRESPRIGRKCVESRFRAGLASAGFADRIGMRIRPGRSAVVPQ